MFRIRVFTPAVHDENGWRHAGGELTSATGGAASWWISRFWNIADYQRQWREGVARLVQGAPSTALMTAYRRDPARAARDVGVVAGRVLGLRAGAPR